MRPLGYVLHRINDRSVPHKTRAYRAIDHIAMWFYNHNRKVEPTGGI